MRTTAIDMPHDLQFVDPLGRDGTNRMDFTRTMRKKNRDSQYGILENYIFVFAAQQVS